MINSTSKKARIPRGISSTLREPRSNIWKCPTTLYPAPKDGMKARPPVRRPQLARPCAGCAKRGEPGGVSSSIGGCVFSPKRFMGQPPKHPSLAPPADIDLGDDQPLYPLSPRADQGQTASFFIGASSATASFSLHGSGVEAAARCHRVIWLWRLRYGGLEQLKHERYKRVNTLFILGVVPREVLTHQLFLLSKLKAHDNTQQDERNAPSTHPKLITVNRAITITPVYIGGSPMSTVHS